MFFQPLSSENGTFFPQTQPPRQFSKISVLFFQEQPFYNFPGGMDPVLRTDMNFPGGLIERTRGGSICSSNRFYHRTDTNPNLVLEHTRIFQEPLFSHRTDTHFPGSSI